MFSKMSTLLWLEQKVVCLRRDCEQMNDCAIRLPNEDNKWLNFNNYRRKERIPFIVYAEFECISEKMEENINIIGYLV